MQFDGEDNYHQVSGWHGKTAPREEDELQAARILNRQLQQTLAEPVQVLTAVASGISRVDCKLETTHGKNLCDPLSIEHAQANVGGPQLNVETL